MSRPKKERVTFVPPPDDHCFICRKPLTDPPGWHCQNQHTTPFVYPWERESNDG